MAELLKALSPIIVLILSGIGWVIKKKWFDDKVEKTSIKQQFKNESRIKRYISRIRDTVDADRVTIKILHNGDHTLHNVCFLRMTMAFESPAVGISYIQQHMSGLLTSHYSESLSELMEHGCIRFSANNQHEMSGVMKSFGTEALYWIAITDILDEPIGVMGIHFREDRTLTHDEIYELKAHCNRLSGHLAELQYENELEFINE